MSAPSWGDTQARAVPLAEWNNTAVSYPSGTCVHELFEAQVKKTPDAIAVAFSDQYLTYRKLNVRANQLAHRLIALGVGPEFLVGICVERSPEMLIALLATLKAGGAYVPLDPNYPRERLAFMLEDAQVRILITRRRFEDRLPQQGAVCIYPDHLPRAAESYSGTDPAPRAKPNNLAYVIYTSGSTGRPKGVMIIHQGLTNYLTWCTKAYAIEQGNGSLVHSSLCFDLTVTGLFAPLLVGRTVHLVPEEHGIDALAAALRQATDLSLVKITPAHLASLGEHFPPADAAKRTRAFVIGGENLTAETIAFWRQHAPETRLINEYGPTETVVGCCVYEVPLDKHRSGSIPIGRPIANTQLYILDPYLRPVPTGVPGELHIGGAGLARGYLNRPELTAEKFIANPFTDEPGSRLYKTGDLACYLADGDIEFLGRMDDQVKIRGFRIELGEVETVLNQYPDVKACAVLAREDSPGDRRLIAYIVSHYDLTSSELGAFLNDKLPEYMLPATFVVLDKFPLTANGKLDRNALPAPEYRSEESFVAPRTPTEEKLAAIFCEVLTLDQVGIHDNFFDLGGHSLLGMQVISRVTKSLEADIQLRALFESPTVAGLAAHVAQAVNEGTAAAALTNDLTALSDEALDALILAAPKP